MSGLFVVLPLVAYPFQPRVLQEHRTESEMKRKTENIIHRVSVKTGIDLAETISVVLLVIFNEGLFLYGVLLFINFY